MVIGYDNSHKKTFFAFLCVIVVTISLGLAKIVKECNRVHYVLSP